MDVNASRIIPSRMGCVAEIPKQTMNAASHLSAEGSGLWRFSLAFYAQPGVADALVALQDGAAADVNLILFALWHGVSGRGRLEATEITAAAKAVQAIRVEIIEPLRALRRRLKPAADADIQHLRERIKALEIDAEKAVQDRLAKFARPASRAETIGHIEDAEANLALCFTPQIASGPDAAIIRRELRRFVEGSPADALNPLRPVHPSV